MSTADASSTFGWSKAHFLNDFFLSGPFTTTTSQGCRFIEDGADREASRSCRIFSSDRSLPVSKKLMERLSRIACSTSILRSFHDVIAAACTLILLRHRTIMSSGHIGNAPTALCHRTATATNPMPCFFRDRIIAAPALCEPVECRHDTYFLQR
jgi:hypothetical protein